MNQSQMDLGSMLQLLQQAKKVAPVMKIHVCSIKGVRLLESTNINDYRTECVAAVQQTTQHTGFNAEVSYDWKWLCSQVLNKIHAAQGDGGLSIELENRCCNLDTCPEVQLMKYFVDQLKK